MPTPDLTPPLLLLHTLHMERTRAFWVDVLAFRVTRTESRAGEVTWLALERGGAGPVFVRPVDNEAPDMREPHLSGQLYFRLPPAPPGDAGTQLDAEAERLAAHGVAFEWGPETMPYGLREFALRDPNGYRVTIGQAVGQ